MITDAVLTCPSCGFKKADAMPPGHAQISYVCPGCRKEISVSEDECCVFCRYSDQHCPAAQDKRNGCCG